MTTSVIGSPRAGAQSCRVSCTLSPLRAWYELCTGAARSITGVRIRQAQGFALIDMIFVCGVIGLLCSIAMPRLFQARQAAGAASAIGSMRAISSGQLTFALTCGAGFYAPNLTTLGTPAAGSNEPFVGAGLGSANTVTKSNYILQLSATPFASAPPSCNGLAAGAAGQGYKAGADPTEPTNPRFFGTNANNVIYEDAATLFPAMPESGAPAAGHILVR
jgi:type II secretory pathway pseudopilin PulG